MTRINSAADAAHPGTHTGASGTWWFLLPCGLGGLGLFLARSCGDGSAGFYAFTVLTAIVYAVAWLVWGSRDAFSGGAWGRELIRGVLIGLALAVVFFVGATVVRMVPFLAEPVAELMATPSHGGLIPILLVLIINGLGEELVYRDVAPRQLRLLTDRPERFIGLVSTALYGVVTIAMGVPLLVFAAVVLGAVCFFEASRSRRLYSPIAVHLTWSIAMLLVLPTFF